MTFLDRPLAQVPFLVVDVETTGIVPGQDRVLELAAVAVVPGSEPKVVLDTLVDPGVPVEWTELHGITDDDVVGAPFLPAVGQALRPLLANRVLVCHNLKFDHAVLRHEQVLHADVPGLCTMELFRALFGDKRDLGRACAYVDVPLDNAHTAAADALATGRLLRKLLAFCRKEKLDSLGALMERFDLFRPTLDRPMLPAPASMVTPEQIGARSRAPAKKSPTSPLRKYLDAVVTVLADLQVDDDELRHIHDLRADLALPPNVQRAVHAKVFGAFLSRYTEDQSLDLREAGHLVTVHRCLSKLGWAPGEEVGY